MNFDDQFKKVESYKVPTLDKRVRLSDFIPGIFKTINSKKGMKNAIKKGLLRVNGEIGYTADYIKGGEIIDLYQSNIPKNKPTIDLNIEVIFEDDYLAIVNKPAGMLVSGNKKWTLENALSSNLKESTKKDALHRPEPIHRLDYPTSGALLVGKTTQTVIALNKLFEERKIEKTYYAVTIGLIEDSGTINTKIDNKTAKTEYENLSRLSSPKYEFLNLTKLKPHTGRRHQLRLHMAGRGNPILGDLKYGKEGLILKGKGLFLHASRLNFVHPISGDPVSVNVPLPKKFKKLFPAM